MVSRVGVTQLPAFVAERRAELLDLWAVYERQIERQPETAVEIALRQPEFAPVARSQTAEQVVEQAKRSRAALREAIVEGDWGPYIEQTRLLGARCVQVGVGYAAWTSVVRVFQHQLYPALVDTYAANPARLRAVLDVTVDFLDFSLALVTEQYVDARQRNHVAERRDLEDRFRALAGATPDAIITADPRGTITYANHASEALFGRSATELLGQPLTMLMPERFRAAHRDGLARYLATRQGRVLGKTLEMPALRSDGTELAIELSIATWDARGEPSFAAIIRDISQRKQIEATLEKRSQQLEDANHELEAFSYSVAHDLRAPLRGMSGFTRVLLEEHAAQLDGDGLGYLTKIQSNVRRMTALIDALLQLSRLSRGDLERKPMDLTRVARSVLAQLAAAEPQRVVEVQVQDGLVATADARLVRTLLENLIGNAWKFTGKTASPLIEIGSIDERTFFVRDNGAGFDLVQAGKLFSPFERLHPDEEFPGTGIGLTTVQRIVHRHGGKIWVLARVNAGATFFFTLAPQATQRGD
jgi:PAS domain S-box-containing protein